MIKKRGGAGEAARVVGPGAGGGGAPPPPEGGRGGAGRSPPTPQPGAGRRIAPPVSPPNATDAIPAATAAPLPPLDPPGVIPSRHGFCVGGKIVFDVPIDAASSGRFVLPRIAIPAARARATGTASPSAIRSRHEAVP